MQDWEGIPIGEEEVAKDLGFSNVDEFRRWQTEMGHKVAELEQQLRIAKDDASNFQWHGKRMLALLNRIEKALSSTPGYEMYRRAIRVVTGREIDWHNEFDDWFKE